MSRKEKPHYCFWCGTKLSDDRLVVIRDRDFCPTHAPTIELKLATKDPEPPAGVSYALRGWLERQRMDPEERLKLEVREAATKTAFAEVGHLGRLASQLGRGSAGKALARRLALLSKMEGTPADKLIVQAVREMLERKGL